MILTDTPVKNALAEAQLNKKKRVDSSARKKSAMHLQRMDLRVRPKAKERNLHRRKLLRRKLFRKSARSIQILKTMLTVLRKHVVSFVANHLKKTGCSVLNVTNGRMTIAPTATIIMFAITVTTHCSTASRKVDSLFLCIIPVVLSDR